MYVIFPADEIILLSYGIAIPRLQPRPTLDHLREPLVPLKGIRPPTNSNLDVPTTHTQKSSITSNHIRFGPNTNATPRQSSKTHRRLFGWRGFSSSTPQINKMASSSGGVLKDLVHPSLNEALKTQNSVTFKLVKTVSDFTESLAQLYEKHAEEMQALVSNYRKKNGELRKERPACQSSLFHAWETFLQEIEADSQSTSELSNSLSRQVARPLLERSFHRKVQSRKVFTHRESFETIIAKTEDKLSKCRVEYKQCYMVHRQGPTQHSLTLYIDSHNAYVQQLHATNAMLEAYNCETVPQLLQELEEIYTDLCNIVAEAVLQGAEAISTRAVEQAKRYEGLSSQCKNVSGQQDLTNFARILPLTPNLLRLPKKIFAPPQPPAPVDGEESLEYTDNSPPTFKNELIIERGASLQLRPSLEALRREAIDLETQIRQLQDSIDVLTRTQQRGLDGSLYNKANELQEDISMKKFDLRAKQIHLSAVRAQKELFLSKLDPGSPNPGGERKMSSASTTSMKTKWLKAFRSLKPAGSGSSGNDRPLTNTNHMYHAVSTVLSLSSQVRIDSDNHNLQEYTYKKITPCDVCSQVLRGHTRQGLRCRICKVNAHADCASQLPKCQVKAKLLRRQKSTSEIENRVDQEEEKPNDLDTIYKVLTKAGEISAAADKYNASGINNQQPTMDIPDIQVPDYPDRLTPRRGAFKSQGSILQPNKQGLTAPNITDVSTPHSPRRQKLNLRMKSLSLDSPESTELHARGRRHLPSGPSGYHGGSGGHLEHSTPPSNNSRLHSPSSPSTQRKLLYANRGLKTGSVDLPDDIEKSLSSASTSPCPSPVSQNQVYFFIKPHRLLPTNLYVVLYNFKSRHQDELDLKAGYKVTVIDTSDPDWWKGKCLGRIGYFPSKYCTKLAAGEKPLQVTHNLQVSDGERGENMTLLRDQIVIQVGEEMNGMVMVRSAENRQGVCPAKYLQEV
ncbi:unnamed protein product [Diamesa serratosioi]